MCKSELFDRILKTVACEAEVSEGEILSRSHRTEVVDARYLLVHFLGRKGFIPAEIARRTGFTPQAVSGIVCKFDRRLEHGSRLFEISYQRIRKLLATE